jgi:hypothetical protein
MKIKFSHFTLGILLSCICFFASCKSDDLLADHHPEIAVPLIHAKTSFREVVGNKATALKIDANGKMRLYYKGTVSERKAVDALKIFPATGIPILFSDSIKKLPFTSDLDIYKVFLPAKTTLTLGCFVPAGFASQMVDGYVLVPSLTKNGVPFKYDFSQVLAGNNAITFGTFSLAGYVLNFSQPGNELTFEYRARTKSGQFVKLNVGGNIQNIGVLYMEAFMKKQDLQLDAGFVTLDFYDEQANGNIKFENPRITVLVENSYGFPMRTKINYIRSVSVNNDTLFLNAKGLTDSGFDFPYPSLQNNEVGQKKTFSYDFTSATSNIKDILNSKPKSILYDIDVVANPNDEKGIGFITDSTNLKIGIEVDIPLYGSAKDFAVKQEFKDIDFASILTSVQDCELKIVADNTLPVGVMAQLDFLDANDKLLTQAAAAPFKIIDAGTVDANGKVSKPAKSETFLPFDVAKTDLLRLCKKVVVRFYFSTSDNGSIPVNIYADQQVNLRIGLKAKTQ